MKNLMIAAAVLMFVAQNGLAQQEKDAGYSYIFFAPGVATPGSTSTAHFGAGAELLFNRVGVGAELGYLTPMRNFRDGIGTLSPNVSYHFLRGKVSPFVTGGYSLFFRSGHASGFNYGAGTNIWVLDKMALRFEVRDNVMAEYHDMHFVGFRAGLSFR